MCYAWRAYSEAAANSAWAEFSQNEQSERRTVDRCVLQEDACVSGSLSLHRARNLLRVLLVVLGRLPRMLARCAGTVRADVWSVMGICVPEVHVNFPGPVRRSCVLEMGVR